MDFFFVSINNATQCEPSLVCLSKLKILSNSSDLTKRLVKRHVDSIIYNADKPLLEELNKIENNRGKIIKNIMLCFAFLICRLLKLKYLRDF